MKRNKLFLRGVKAFLLVGLCFFAHQAYAAGEFKATFRTSSPNEVVRLPLFTGQGYTHSYGFSVDWGDGSPIDSISAYNQAERDHAYATPGDHQVTITGSMPMWLYRGGTGNQGYAHQLISIDDAGSVGFGTGITNFYAMFAGAYNLQSVALFDTSSGTDLSYMFYGASALTGIPQFDTSSATEMFAMFSYDASLASFPLINTSNVENFSYMFYQATSLTTMPLIDTSTGTNFFAMFSYSGLQSLPAINTSNGTNMAYLVSYTPIVDMPDLDGSASTTFEGIYEGCTSMETGGALSGAQYSIDYSYTQLPVSELRDALDALGYADNTDEQQTITLSDVPGINGLLNSYKNDPRGWELVASGSTVPGNVPLTNPHFYPTN